MKAGITSSLIILIALASDLRVGGKGRNHFVIGYLLARWIVNGKRDPHVRIANTAYFVRKLGATKPPIVERIGKNLGSIVFMKTRIAIGETITFTEDTVSR